MEGEYDVDAVLIGEIHGVAAHGDEAYDITDAVDPEYLALEAGQEVDLEEKLTEFYHFQTLDRINQVCETVTGEPYVQDADALQTAIYQRWQEEEDDPTGVVPESADELLSTRISEFDVNVRYMLKEYADIREQQEDDPVYGDISETVDYWKKQDRKGRRSQARFIDNIYEDVKTGRFIPVPWDTRKFDPDVAQFDLPPSDEDKEVLEQSYRQREEFGAEKVAEYVEQTDRPVVVMMGKTHLSDDAVFTDTLDDLGVSYETTILDTTIEEDVQNLVAGEPQKAVADD